MSQYHIAVWIEISREFLNLFLEKWTESTKLKLEKSEKTCIQV